MAWFLIVYDRSQQQTLRCDPYTDAEYEQAWAARSALTISHIGDRNIEVVLLGSGSLAEVRGTHPRYFHSVPVT